MPRDTEDLHRLYHIWEAGNDALLFTRGRSREALDTDRMLRYALVRALEIIGEAAGKITPAFRAQHPAIPWNDMIGMRNRLAHAYFDVNLGVVWYTVHESLPALLALIRPVLLHAGMLKPE